MPAADTQQRRAGLPLLPGLLWAGVGLAPVAALLVLFSGDSLGLMRLAVLLAVVAVVLIGISMALRQDPSAMRNQVEDMVYEELDILREDLREDITTAARATHKSLGERVVNLQTSVETLRGQFDNLRMQVERGTVAQQAAPPPVQPAAAPQPVPTPTVVAGHGHGVVRHTETVKVTTRQTIVDQNDSGRGTVYGSSQASDPVPSPRRSREDDEEESWSEQLLRQRREEDRYDEPRYGGYQSDDRYGGFVGGVEERGGGRRRAPEPDDDADRITGMRTGDRWASVRSDERGRELRMGERRTAMHADPSGSEIRIEDRWAAVRRDEDQRGDVRREPERGWERGRDADRGREAPRERDGDWGRGSAYWSEPGAEEPRIDPTQRWGERPAARPALPATPSEPSASSWVQGWSARPEPTSERARRSYGDEDEGYRWGASDDDGVPPARSARARSAEYDTGQERWR